MSRMGKLPPYNEYENTGYTDDEGLHAADGVDVADFIKNGLRKVADVGTSLLDAGTLGLSFLFKGNVPSIISDFVNVVKKILRSIRMAL